jgi:hypothetical protein
MSLPCRLAGLLLACLGFVSAAPARADLIDVQFAGAFSYNCPGGGNSCSNAQQAGAAYVGSAGDQWNYNKTASGSGSLIDASGASSGLSINYSSDAPYSPYTDGTNKNNFATTSYANLYGGYIATTGNGISITLSGLYAGEAYNLYVYSEQDGTGSSGRSARITANGVSAVDTQDGAGTFILNANYVLLSGTANASGQVVINVANLNGEADINGLQLQTLPEPASLSIFGAGLAGLGWVRRRRKR